MSDGTFVCEGESVCALNTASSKDAELGMISHGYTMANENQQLLGLYLHFEKAGLCRYKHEPTPFGPGPPELRSGIGGVPCGGSSRLGETSTT